MQISAVILADSLAPSGARLTTWELKFPRRPVHDELMTHRMFSRNAASSRAIPTEKLINQVLHQPALPNWVGANKAGMQADEELSPEERAEYLCDLRGLANQAAAFAARWAGRVHKQHVNRYLEPWQQYTMIVSATDFDNFFKLRTDKMAQPEIRELADAMYDIYHSTRPMSRSHRIDNDQKDCWHLPLISAREYADNPIDLLRQVSVARCARVSYLTHDGKRDLTEDVRLFNRLLSAGHWSPFEHVAEANTACKSWVYSGNFRGWIQWRKTFEEENVLYFRKRC